MADNGRYIADVSIPDDLEIQPGNEFVKTWRVQNTGDTTWQGYSLVFVGGNAMGSPTLVPIPVATPGQQIEISINQVAPRQAGTHFGDWKLQNAAGEQFGEIIYLRIVVPGDPKKDVETKLPDAQIIGSFAPEKWRDTIFAITSVFESGSPAGNPSAYQTYDAGIISYGKHQATLGSGTLARVLDAYFGLSNSATSQALKKEYASRVTKKDATLRGDGRIKQLLLDAAQEAAMNQAQDNIFDQDFYQPAIQQAKQNGLQTPLGLSALYDTNIQGGMYQLIPQTNEKVGKIGAGVNEPTWIATFLDLREVRLNTLADRSEAKGNSVNAQALRKSTYRVVELRNLLMAGNLALTGTLHVRGQQIQGIDLSDDKKAATQQLQTGMNINPDAPYSDPVDSGELKGMDWVRWVFKYAARANVAERSDINAAFRQFDPLVQKYVDQGVNSLIVLNQETVWANAPWNGSNDWGTFGNELAKVARQIAQRYAKYGDKVGYEIWNEGDLPNNPASVYVPPEQFAIVLQRTAQAIREVSPDSPLVFGGLASGPGKGIPYLQTCLAAMGGQWPVDGIGIHPYGRWGSKAPFDWANTFGTLDQAFAQYRQAFGNLPLWITEIGVAADGEIGPEHYATIAEYMRDVYGTVASKYVQQVPVLIWFAWSDLMRNSGMVNNQGQKKANVYEAFVDVRNKKF